MHHALFLITLNLVHKQLLDMSQFHKYQRKNAVTENPLKKYWVWSKYVISLIKCQLQKPNRLKIF